MAALVTRRLSAMERPISLFDELARDLWYSTPFAPSTWVATHYPRMDMFEEKNDLVVRAELPGMKKEDIDISIEGDMLTIKAEKKEEKVEKETNYYTCERSFGQYVRSVSLPFPVDFDKTSSVYENGVLEVRLAKTAESKAKHIEVKVK